MTYNFLFRKLYNHRRFPIYSCLNNRPDQLRITCRKGSHRILVLCCIFQNICQILYSFYHHNTYCILQNYLQYPFSPSGACLKITGACLKMLSDSCASHFVGNSFQLKAHSGLYNLNLELIYREAGCADSRNELSNRLLCQRHIFLTPYPAVFHTPVQIRIIPVSCLQRTIQKQTAGIGSFILFYI